jgi:cytochrome P450
MIPEIDQDPRAPDFVQNPYPYYDRVRALGPVFRWAQYGHICAAGYAEVNALLRDKRFGRSVLHVTSRAALGWPEPDPALAEFHAVERHSLLELEPPDHTRLRGLVTRAFVSRVIEQLRPGIAKLTNELIDRFPSPTVDLLEAFATPIPVRAITALLGVPPDMAPQLLAWSHAMVAMYQFRRSAAEEATANVAAREFAAFIRSEIAARHARSRDDLISQLVAAGSDGGRLSEAEIIGTVILLLNAGHEASVHVFGNGIKTILESGLDPTALFATPAATTATVEEILRFDPPLHMFTRYALQDVEIGGARLRVGGQIGLMLGAANRDPGRYPNPDSFDPTRDAAGHTSFGAGIHFCLGAPLARLEFEVALPILFARLPRLALAGPPVYRDTYHFHGLERLVVEYP